MIYLIFLEKQNHVSYRLYRIHENIKERANTQRHNNHPKKGFRRLFIGICVDYSYMPNTWMTCGYDNPTLMIKHQKKF